MKYPFDQARRLAYQIVDLLAPACQRIAVAGSIRRQRPEVGDIEILYIPKTELGRDPHTLFGERTLDLAAAVLDDLIQEEIIAKRPNSRGFYMWGLQNKLATHVKTGIPVDFFATTAASWWNYLVCRTGPAESNIAIAAAARRKGWKWQPYSVGFRDQFNRIVPMQSEEEVFQSVGLPYLPPEQRGSPSATSAKSADNSGPSEHPIESDNQPHPEREPEQRSQGAAPLINHPCP